jgi:dihydrofolate reductase
MRRIRYAVAMSLDGYIAGPNGEADWIVMDPEVSAGFAAFYAEFDTLLLGRRTFVATGAHGPARSGPFAGFDIVVCSTTLNPTAHPGVRILSGDLESELDRLRRADGKDIWLFGGGGLCRSLLDLGLVDTMEVGIIPVVLGEGIPFVAPGRLRRTLSLRRHRVFPATGTVSLQYDVSKKPARPVRRGRHRGA